MNSCNNWLDKIFTYGKDKDTNFQIDDTNHTHLPEGTETIVAGQTMYSFLTDQDGNRITNLTSVTLLEIATNKETALTPVNKGDSTYDFSSFGVMSGTPTSYDKIADNIIKLNFSPSAGDASKYLLKYYFQRSPSYFVASDTTKEPGVANDLHRGFVVASAYDGALTLGLANLGALAAELQKEEIKLERYISTRNTDSVSRLTPSRESNR